MPISTPTSLFSSRNGSSTTPEDSSRRFTTPFRPRITDHA